MDEGVFIIVALVIVLGLFACLYFVVDLLSQRVLGFASEARGREQREIVNHERLARTLNDLVDEVAMLTDALKNERILRSHADATGRVAAKKAAPTAGATPELAPTAARAASADRRTAKVPPPPDARAGTTEAGDEGATRVLAREDMPVRAPPPEPC